MEPVDQYNFSIFRPRNLHGRKNRNVILSMLVIWAVAVFGFQFLLKGIQKPIPEKALIMFESTWPSAPGGNLSPDEFKTLLRSLVLVKGKTTVKPEDRGIISGVITCALYGVIPDTVRSGIIAGVSDLKTLKTKLTTAGEQEYLDIRDGIAEKVNTLVIATEPFSGFKQGTLEATILISSLDDKYAESLSDNTFDRLPEIMKLYLTHNQSVLTDTKFLGFPFHYFYTAVFLLILFVVLCIVYNILIEWRLRKEGIIES